MSVNPAMLLYTSDFLIGVSFMDMESRGQYITLICLQHQKGHMSLDEMKFAVGNINPNVMSRFKKDKEGLYYNERAEEEILKRQAYSLSRKNNRSKSAAHNKQKNTSSTYVEDMDNENDNDNEEENEKEKEKYLSEFNDDVKKAFISFLNMRKSIKKPVTNEALKRLVNKLNSLSITPSEQIKIINRSEDNCWLSFYELKEKNDGINEFSSFETGEFFRAATRHYNGI